MKKIAMLSVCLILLLWGTSAMAVGMGPYFGFNYSMLDDSVFGSSYDVNINHYVFGFALDTCTSQDSLFNYRFNIGFNLADLKTSRSGRSSSYTGYGFDMKHTFGFGIVRNSVARLWAGPAIGMHFDMFSEGGNDLYTVGGGAGPVLGANFHLGGGFSLGVSAGYMYQYSTFIDDDGDTESGGEHRIFVQLTPLVNFGRDRDVWH